MSDDAFTTRSEEPASQDFADQEPEDAMAEGSPEAADAGGDDGGGTGMLGPLELPSTGRMFVVVGGAAMALSTLLSWLEVGNDSFPNIAGVGVSTFGVGTIVFLAGLLLVLRRLTSGVAMGIALGALGSTLVYITIVGLDNGLAAGVWVGLAGSAIAVLGALILVFEEEDRPQLQLRPSAAALGAALAVVASFWLDWVLNSSALIANRRTGEEAFNGLHSEVLFGFPILILGGIVLVLLTELTTMQTPFAKDRQQWIYLMIQMAGVAIAVTAGSNVVGLMMLGVFAFGSGPLVALVGGVIITRSIKEA
ncbi:hypothetical protein [Candidatus Poriferisocius sp.]|uniref:hypothetical protein n=1 Tax=Candidatus Poriferisocius sp. TaxID=3101276 RepID=UPI003B011696